MRKFLMIIVFVALCLSFSADISWTKEKWKEYRSTHFIVYYQKSPKDFAETVAESAEQSYRDIVRNLGFIRYKGWTYDDRVKIYIYDDAEHFQKSAYIYKWSHGVASPKDRIIRTYPSAHGFFDSTLPHEVTHILFREFIGFDKAIPLWFEEGVAMNQEKAKRWGSDAMVKQAQANGTFIPINELSTMRLSSRTPIETVHLFYTEGASIVYFMNTKFGERRFERFCRELRDGTSFERALKKVYVRIKSYEDLNKEWLKYLKDQ